jgi:hypothetical protein
MVIFVLFMSFVWRGPLVEQPPRNAAVRNRQMRTVLVLWCGRIMTVLR